MLLVSYSTTVGKKSFDVRCEVESITNDSSRGMRHHNIDDDDDDSEEQASIQILRHVLR